MFDERISFTIKLSSGANHYEVAPGRVKRCELELAVHGFEAQLSFWNDPQTEDELFAWFIGNDLIEIELTLVPAVSERSASQVRLRGLVAERTVLEIPDEVMSRAFLREYRLRFVDAAALLWRQHQPLELVADSDDAEATVAAVIQAQAVNGIAVEVALDDAKRARPMVCVPLGGSPASFYDFVVWYAERAGASFQHAYYDDAAHHYRLADKRPTHAGDFKLANREVAASQLSLPAPPRHDTRVLNAFSDATDRVTAVTQPSAVKGIARDQLVRTPAPASVEARGQLEKDRLQAAYPELTLELARFPGAEIMPGAKIQLRDDEFARGLFAAEHSFRVIALALIVDVDGDHNQLDDGRRVYHATLSLRCESEDDRRARLPPHAPPSWPIFVEGRIAVDAGDVNDRIYLTSEDSESGLAAYSVHVPLWNQTVKVPFGPQFLPGHFFAPAFKGSRVLLALYFEHAEIAQFLDWGADVQLPAESGGNHLLFGKNKTSQTSLKHVYVSGKPVLSLSRVADADHGRFQLDDGALVLEVMEDPGASETAATESLVVEQDMAKEKLKGDSKKSLGKINGSAEANGRKLDDKLTAAETATKAKLEAMKSELGGKTESASGQLKSGLDAVDEKMADMNARVQAAVGELQAKGQK